MGNCFKPKPSPGHTSKSVSLDQGQNNPNFQVNLSGVKICFNSFDRGIQLLTVEICLAQVMWVVSCHLNENEQFVSSETHEFEIKLPLDSLNEIFAEIIIKNANKVLGTAEIPLVSILEGPVKQNFPFASDREFKGRIKFLAEIQEKTTIKVHLQELKCLLDETRAGEWAVSFRIVADSEYESPVSEDSPELSWIYTEGVGESPLVCFPATVGSLRDANIKIRL